MDTPLRQRIFCHLTHTILPKGDLPAAPISLHGEALHARANQRMGADIEPHLCDPEYMPMLQEAQRMSLSKAELYKILDDDMDEFL
jgi:hypothetical protein